MSSLPPPRISLTARSSCFWTADARARLASSGVAKVVWLDAGPARHNLTDPAANSAQAASAARAVDLRRRCFSNPLFIAGIISNSLDRLDRCVGAILIGDLPPRDFHHHHGNPPRSF